MPEYTSLTVLAILMVLAVELLWLRTGVLTSVRYWVSIAIVLGFQVLVDGRLTALPDPIVAYDEQQITGLRFPFDIPVEDFGFGFAMVTAVLMLWVRYGRGRVTEGRARATDGRGRGQDA